jgi:hypothetical protein
MFYAPCKYLSEFDLDMTFFVIGCGHCKSLKPELIQASIDLHEQNVRKINKKILFFISQKFRVML